MNNKHILKIILKYYIKTDIKINIKHELISVLDFKFYPSLSKRSFLNLDESYFYSNKIVYPFSHCYFYRKFRITRKKQVDDNTIDIN